jgi:hypothetical protein
MKTRSSLNIVGRGYKKGFKGNQNFREGVKREDLNRFGWRRSIFSCVGLEQLGAAGTCQ